MESCQPIKRMKDKKKMGRDSSVGIANGYGLDGPGFDFPHLSIPALEPNHPPIQWVPGLFPGEKRPGRGVNHQPI